MPRYKLLIEYAGTRYSGWQIQKNARTVQGEIERAVGTVAGRRDFELYGSGRTDAGVHALGQVAHLDVRSSMLAPELLRRRINDELPADINVLRIEQVSHRFHARHDAVARSYLYQIARRRTAFAKHFVWWVREDLDLARMREAAALFVGLKDFRSFTEADPEDTSTRVHIDRFDISEAGDLILVHIQGSHFIWKLVRRLVGVLVECGRGGLTGREVEGFLHASSRAPARLTAPPSGLFLEHVFYEGDRRDLPLLPVVNLARPR